MTSLINFKRLTEFIPHLDSKERTVLYSSLGEGAVCDSDFLIMMCLSTAIATLGLMIGSPAIIIGAMVVAPLMTPLIAAGCALVRGDVSLFQKSIRAMIFGSIMALGISFLIGVLIPNDTLTLEMISRGKPDILDLFVGLFAGAAAAYATARPKVMASLVGVAVAAALVPPIATVGIAITEGHKLVAQGAFFLFVTNLVAIVLGAAAMFYLMGIRGLYKNTSSPLFLRRVLLGMILLLGLLCAPLGYRMADRIKEGQLRPIAYPLSTSLSEAIRERIAKEPGVNLLSAGRMGVEYEASDIGVFLYSTEPAPLSLKEDLVDIVKDFRGKDVRVKVLILAEGTWMKVKEVKQVEENT
ncbi:MAG: TIGR00341 family protein [Deltaproteobacteria bacterium]|nr:TIGR00341 family protein [Deltaproteobacteria bacterium]